MTEQPDIDLDYLLRSLEEQFSATSLPLEVQQNGIQQQSPLEKKTHYVEISALLATSQKKAAQRLGMPSSTLAKRYKEVFFKNESNPLTPKATLGRVWPYRRIKQLDKKIDCLQRNYHNSKIRETLEELVKERIQLLAPVKIRV